MQFTGDNFLAEFGSAVEAVLCATEVQRVLQALNSDLAALSTLEAVIVGGRLYRKSELDAALERHRAHFAGSLYDGLSEFLSRVLLRIMAPPGTALLPDE